MVTRRAAAERRSRRLDQPAGGGYFRELSGDTGFLSDRNQSARDWRRYLLGPRFARGMRTGDHVEGERSGVTGMVHLVIS